MENLKDDSQRRKEDLEREKQQSSMLDNEVESLKKSLREAQRKNASLEAEVCLKGKI